MEDTEGFGPESELEEEEKPVSQQIRDLLTEGYTAQQLVRDFGFARQTVIDEATKGKKRNPDNSNGKAFSQVPIKMSQKDMVPPEYALEHIRLQDGEYKTGFVDGMSVLLLAARYNQIMASSQAEVMKGQIEIFKIAQGGAEQSVKDVAAQVAGAIGESHSGILDAIKQQQVATSSNPMQTMMMQTMQPYLGQIMGQMMSGMMPRQQPGQPPPQQPPQYEQPGEPYPPQQPQYGQPGEPYPPQQPQYGQPGEPYPPQQPQPGQPPPSTNIEYHDLDELDEEGEESA